MTQIRILVKGDETLLETFLRPQLESSLFLLSNMRRSGLVDGGERYHGTYAAAFIDEKIVGTVAHYWNDNLVLQAPAYLALLVRAVVRTSNRPVAGIIGPGDQVTHARELLEGRGTDARLNEVERLYALDLNRLIVPDGLRSGQLRGRLINPDDVDLITDWRVAYSLETLGNTDKTILREQSRENVERAVVSGDIWILEEGGIPVASSGFNARLDEVVQVGGVYTLPHLRRRGYGRSVVAASLLDARAESVQKAVLFTAEDNVPAQKAYEALGFKPIGRYGLLLLHQPATLINQDYL